MAGYYFLALERDRRLNFFVKVGMANIANKQENGGGTITFREVESLQLVVGLGAEWRYQESPWFMRLDLDAYDRDALYAGLSVVRYIGGPKAKLPEPIAVPPPAKKPAPLPEPVAEPAPTIACRNLEIAAKGLQFKADSAELSDTSKQLLTTLALDLTQFADVRIEVQAHTDSDGSEAYNQNLSQRRAQSVVAFLVAEGVSFSRMNAKGYGEALPLASNATAQGKAQNRRVEFKLLDDLACEQ